MHSGKKEGEAGFGSEFSKIDELLKGAGVDTKELDVQNALNKIQGTGNPVSVLPSKKITKEEEKMAEKKAVREKKRRSGPVQLDAVSKQAVADFQKAKDLRSFATAVQTVKEAVKDVTDWKLAEALGVPFYWIKDRMLLFELHPETQNLLINAKTATDITPSHLKKLVAKNGNDQTALAQQLIEGTAGSKGPVKKTKGAKRSPVSKQKIVLKTATTPIAAAAVAGINAHIEDVMGPLEDFLRDLVTFSQLPSSILEKLIDDASVHADLHKVQLQQAAEKIYDSII